MMRANAPQWLTDEKGIKGLSLGKSGYKQHTFGILQLCQSFQLPSHHYGSEIEQIRIFPKYLEYREGIDHTDISYHPEMGVREAVNLVQWKSEEDSLVTAWDQTSFFIRAVGKTRSFDRSAMRELWYAFSNLDVCFYVAESGLVIGIV